MGRTWGYEWLKPAADGLAAPAVGCSQTLVLELNLEESTVSAK